MGDRSILDNVTNTWSLFDRLADRYDRVVPFFADFARQLVDILDSAPGTRLVDIGTGRGAVATVAAARGCVVTAIDAAPRMVALLTAEHPEIDARVMDAQDLDLPEGSFDIAAGAFVIHLVDDPARVLAELRRVVRPGGTIALTTPGPCDDGGRWDAFHALVGTFEPRTIGPDRPGHRVDVLELLTAAGFVQIHTTTIETHLPVADPDTAWRFHMSHGFAGFVEALTPADAGELRERAMMELSRMHTTGGITLDRGAMVYLATDPDPGTDLENAHG